jgi:hypothetical protein
MFDSLGDDCIEKDPERCASFVHDATCAYMAHKGSKGEGKGKKGKGKSEYHKRNSFNFANLACKWEQQDEWATAYLAEYDDEPYNDPAYYEDDYAMYYYNEEEWYEEEEVAYVAEEWQVEDAKEAAELDCIACMFDSLGDDCIEKDPERCASFMKDGTCAFMANNKGSKGKGRGKKGKGKYPVRPSNLSIEDRRKKLAELKARTPCRACGRNGQWQGDKECTMSRQKTGHLAVKSVTSAPKAQRHSALQSAMPSTSMKDRRMME